MYIVLMDNAPKYFTMVNKQQRWWCNGNIMDLPNYNLPVRYNGT
jgi:hypothetical protein